MRGGGSSDKTNLLNNNIDLDLLHSLTHMNTDIDTNIYTDTNINSAFYDTETFISKFKHSKSPLFLNLNTQSLMSKHEKLKNFILNLTNNGLVIDIIALQETWLIKHPHLLNIPGFQPIIYTNRSKGRGGGVGFYVREGLNYTINKNLSQFKDKIFESLTIDVTYTHGNNTKHFLATSLYRSPSPITNMTQTDQIDEFMDKLDRLLSDINNMNTDAYILTDSNINLLNMTTDQTASHYMTNLTNNGFLVTNHKATRMQGVNSSLIDHIITNCKQNSIYSGSITEDISDHFLTFIQPNLRKHKTKPVELKRRLYTPYNMDRFKNDLQQLTWNDVTATTDVDTCYDTFWNTYNFLHEQHFPLTTTKFNKNFHKISTFMTPGLLTSRRTKIHLHHTALTDNTQDNWDKYRTYRNLFNKLIKASKRQHYDNHLKTHAKNSKKTWEILKELTTGKTTQVKIDKIKVNGEVITDNRKMANAFNAFFTEAGKNIYNSVEPTTKKPTDYIPDNSPPLMEFNDINEVMVISTISNMDPKSSVDASGISMKMIKFIKHQIAKPLAHLFNLSVTTGVFPSKLKTSRTIPVYKAGDNTSCDNYRPISLLSSLSKVLEKIIANKLVNHLEINNLLHPNQYGFQKNKSTVHNITMLINRVAHDLNDKKFVAGIFLDLRKAFDVVSHKILLDKLKKLGIKDKVLDWFTSYLDNRQQYTEIGGEASTHRLIDISVLQGSILGPILFLCFINDLHLSTDLLTLLFADDTVGLDSDHDLPTLVARVNSEIQKLANWFRTNRMAVNISKTKYIIFRPRGQRIGVDLDNQGIVYNDNELGQPCDPTKINKLGRVHNDNTDIKERTYKFLGIYLDEYLSFDKHCDVICNKLATSNFIINRSKHLLTPASLKTLYYSLVHPHILYALPIYSCTSQKNRTKIYKMQKKAIRTISKAKYNAITAPLFHAQSILPLHHLITYTQGQLMHSIYHKYCPTPLHNAWHTLEEIRPDHNLRNAHNLYTPFARTDHVKRLSYFALPDCWNNLPDDKLGTNKTTFKIALRDYLFRLTEEEASVN